MLKADSGMEEQKATGEPTQQENQKENIRKDVPMQIGIGKGIKLIATAQNCISPSGQGRSSENVGNNMLKADSDTGKQRCEKAVRQDKKAQGDSCKAKTGKPLFIWHNFSCARL